MIFRNLTPHAIIVKAKPFANDGVEEIHTVDVERTFKPSGDVARVETLQGEVKMFDDLPVTSQGFGEIIDLPAPQAETFYIVSAIVLAAAKAEGRTDCVAPDTAHAERNDAGHIVSVPGFVS